jgi:signal transduction histidine kinase
MCARSQARRVEYAEHCAGEVRSRRACSALCRPCTLHPASLRILGLAPALKGHCAEVGKRHNVEVGFKAGDLGHLDPDIAVCFFRIAQESLRNGVMHGEATRFDVSLARFGEHIEMTVTDNGRGFDLEAARQNGGGLGLVSMEERAHVVGGGVQIVTGVGQGTTVRVRGPVEPPKLTSLPA